MFKFLFVLSIGLMVCSQTASSQEICKVFGQKNPHGVGMEIKAPMSVVDAVNFSVESVTPLPYNIGPKDTIFFRVCLKQNDGKMYSTQVRYNTTHGMVSYNVTMQAVNSGVSSSDRSDLVAVFPNPSNVAVTFRLPNAPFELLDLYDPSGKLVASYNVEHRNEFVISTTTLPPGMYLASFKGTESSALKFEVRH